MAEVTSPGPDDGRAAERTVLAWQRTALALATVTAVGTRVAVDRLGLVALLGLLGLPLSAWVFVESWRQQRAASSGDEGIRRDGRVPCGLTAAVTLAAATEIAVQTVGPAPTS